MTGNRAASLGKENRQIESRGFVAQLGRARTMSKHRRPRGHCSFEEVKGSLAGNPENELATQLLISPEAIDEAMQRGLLTFLRHRNALSWRFGDARNGCLRRLDGHPFKINGERVKAKAETRGEPWHRLIGLDDVVANGQRGRSTCSIWSREA